MGSLSNLGVGCEVRGGACLAPDKVHVLGLLSLGELCLEVTDFGIVLNPGFRVVLDPQRRVAKGHDLAELVPAQGGVPIELH